MSELLKSKIRKYIKLLRKRNEKYSFKQAYDLLYQQVKMEEAFNEADMETVADEIWSRLKENWPFENKI